MGGLRGRPGNCRLQRGSPGGDGKKLATQETPLLPIFDLPQHQRHLDQPFPINGHSLQENHPGG